MIEIIWGVCSIIAFLGGITGMLVATKPYNNDELLMRKWSARAILTAPVAPIFFCICLLMWLKCLPKVIVQLYRLTAWFLPSKTETKVELNLDKPTPSHLCHECGKTLRRGIHR